MSELNLCYKDKSLIRYRINSYPDGQKDIVINTQDVFKYIFKYGLDKSIQIKSRLNNTEDLLMIICATKALRNLKVKEIHLYTPYFLGSRSDRQFKEGSINYLKDVICPIINSLNFESVTVLDPHSDILEACLNNFKKESNNKLVITSLFGINKEIAGIQGIYPGMFNNLEYLDKFILISSDTGASKKIYKLAEQIGYKGEIISCSKNRDVNGKLTKIVVPIETNAREDFGKNLGKDIIIIDDICDGGTRFINIVKEIHRKLERNGFTKKDKEWPKIYLIVTHGIFSKGFGELSKYFNNIYCTNSYRDFLEYSEIGKLRQLNVF